MSEILIFIIFLIAPFLYWRFLFLLAEKRFDKPFTREKTGLQVHHAHFGIICVLIASLMILFGEKNIYSIAILGLGLGLVLDEFIPSLMMPGNRPVELAVYKKSLNKTFCLFLFIIVLVLVLALIN